MRQYRYTIAVTLAAWYALQPLYHSTHRVSPLRAFTTGAQVFQHTTIPAVPPPSSSLPLADELILTNSKLDAQDLALTATGIPVLRPSASAAASEMAGAHLERARIHSQFRDSATQWYTPIPSAVGRKGRNGSKTIISGYRRPAAPRYTLIPLVLPIACVAERRRPWFEDGGRPRRARAGPPNCVRNGPAFGVRRRPRFPGPPRFACLRGFSLRGGKRPPARVALVYLDTGS
jgi:hypothetical protein